MPIQICRTCSVNFYAKPFLIKKGWGKYCSSKCQYLGRRKGRNICCYVCNKEVYRNRKALTQSKSGNYFCGKSCQTKWRNSEFIGPKHANWRHGGACYKSVLTRNNVSKMCNLCKTTDERLLAVHHIDRDHKNNKLENLAWLCHNCHHLVHHDKSERERFMVAIV